MNQILRLIALAILLALGFWLWTVFFPSPQKAVERRLTKLARLASFTGQEGNLTRVATVERMGAYFTEDVQVILDIPGLDAHTFDRKADLMQAALAARSAISGLDVKFADLNIIIGPDHESATAELTLEAKISGQNDLIIQELRFTFKKVDRTWLITRVETVKRFN